jgi:hypothetical protein
LSYLRWPLLALVWITAVAITTACGAVSQDAAAPVAQSVAGDAAFESPESALAESSEEFRDGESVPLGEYLVNAVRAQEARVIIYTGNMSLVVRDTEEAVTAITNLANEHGGFVAGSDIYQSGEALRGSVSIRVPAERYQDMVAQLRNLALRVEQESSSTQDVTEEFTDLQARKTNLEFTEQALQQLLEERQTVGSTSDILEVHRELTAIRGQIEQIEGRLRFLANQAALSTISIELTPDILYQPITVGGWEPQGVARQALQALVVALQALANVLIWLIVFALPLLGSFLIPVVILVLIVGGVWQRRQLKRGGSGGSTAAS